MTLDIIPPLTLMRGGFWPGFSIWSTVGLERVLRSCLARGFEHPAPRRARDYSQALMDSVPSLPYPMNHRAPNAPYHSAAPLSGRDSSRTRQ